MGGGLMQLVAYGAQDIYLTGEPQITFFKVVYRRHTNFAIESIEQTFTGSDDLGKKVSCVVSRNGDLVNGIHLEVVLPVLSGTTAYTPAVGHALIQSAEIEIGGQKVDKHYGEWLEIWDELTASEEKSSGYMDMVAKDATVMHTGGETLYIPLQFWFNRNPGLALPLIALQYHEVKVLIEFRPFADLLVENTGGTITGKGLTSDGVASEFQAKLYVDYVYLDTEERRRFAQMSHEYLIDQLQHTGAETVDSGNSSLRLNFNHPVKELVWVFQSQADIDKNDRFNFGTKGKGVEVLKDATLLLNGHERFSSRPASYFRLMQPYQHHTRVPAKPIYVYSFALRPEEHQPSGTCNFSRIDNASLKINTESAFSGNVLVYAVNYNVLRIVSGMGGLAYSN
uniref:Major capsid protein n=1 Tax=viral metagenome TaxID=1070528 RepID=A0A6C0K9I3_9ZZZZ